jgi:hypothetical protein
VCFCALCLIHRLDLQLLSLWSETSILSLSKDAAFKCTLRRLD